MSDRAGSKLRSRTPGQGRRRLISAALLLATAGSVGCESDSWLYDPSIVGRWEHTPTVVPILERIDVIERDRGEFVETTPVMPEDLLPEVTDYEVGPGDAILMEIFDFLTPNVPTQLQRVVDPRGFIDLPQLGRINVLSLTADEIRERIRQELREQGVIEDALVSVQLVGQRQQTFSIFGAIQGVGRYFIPAPNYRLLEALTEAGGVSPAIRKVYVIRQTPLSDQVRTGAGVERATRPDMPDRPQEPDDAGRDLSDLIRELTTPQRPPQGSPGMMSGGRGGVGGPLAWRQDQDDPPIDLPDSPGEQPRPRIAGPEPVASDPDGGRWMFLNGEWVRVSRKPVAAAPGLPEAADPLGGRLRAEDLITQRVIEIPTEPLIQGIAEYNIVIRPGDVIRVPSPEQGIVYIGGPGIARGGAFNLPVIGRLTLTKAIISAGGLSAIAVPWRVDLTRMVGDDRQATIRLNLAAIFEGTQPDVFLKPDDVVNVGTAFWATPLAVIRNGFRASYGFGFLLDRNFGNDVFGAPPSNQFGG